MTFYVFCLHFPVWCPCWACYRFTINKDQKCLNLLTVANLPYFNSSCYQFEKIPSRTHRTSITASLETNSWHFSFQCSYLINHIFWKPILCNSIVLNCWPLLIQSVNTMQLALLFQLPTVYSSRKVALISAVSSAYLRLRVSDQKRHRECKLRKIAKCGSGRKMGWYWGETELPFVSFSVSFSNYNFWYHLLFLWELHKKIGKLFNLPQTLD